MKLCYISTYWHEYELGGVETYLKNIMQISSLVEEVHFLIPNPNSSKVRIKKKGNIIIHHLPFVKYIVDEKTKVKDSKKLLNYLDSLISDYGIDLLETQNLVKKSNYFFSINMIAIKHNIPLVERLHIFPSQDYEFNLHSELPFDKILCVSKTQAEFLYKKGIDSKKLKVIYPGIDTDSFQPLPDNYRKKLGFTDKDIVLLQASRISNHNLNVSTLEEKGVLTFLKGFSLISDKYPNAKVLLATAKPNEKYKSFDDAAIKEIYDYCDIYNIRNKVIIQSFDFAEMNKVYNSANIFVMMSQKETFGLVYAEAMACGIPVVGSSNTAVLEVISNASSGYLIEPDNSVELSKRLSWLIKNKEKRIRFGERGKSRVNSKFQLDNILLDLVKTYSKLISSHKK